MSFRKRLTPAYAWETCMEPPQLPRRTSAVICVVNVFLPGVGTMAAGAITDTMETFLMGALQLLTSVFLLGWLWSVAWGVELLHRSVRRGSSSGEGGSIEGGGLGSEGGAASTADGWATTAAVQGS